MGRYDILEEIGRGGMGVVYAAHDPELDRTVALKVLRSRRGDRAAADRLVREAQALARLSHPNVVHVYDVGEVDDQVFLAMERVDGVTLGEWVEERRHSWEEAVAVFRAAGEGLAAAHDAGLVHRDFKPANVLIGADNRVRVADFGVARFRRAVRTESSGGLVGTPRYIAPETVRGHRADPRADQFSFCVAFHEALYGTTPYAGSGLGELCAQAEAGAVRPAPPGSDVPGWLRALVLRGLRADPAERFPSMRALLEELGRDRSLRPRRAWLLAGAAMVAAGLGLGGLMAWRAHRAGLCSGGAQIVARVWNPGRRAELERAFMESHRTYAGEALARASAALDAYAAAWSEAHRDACTATRLRGEQSDSLLDRRMACLDRRLQEFDALVGVFATATPEVVERGAQAAAALPRLEECADLAALSGPLPLPVDPVRREAIAAAAVPLARAQALQAAGRYAEGLALAGQAVAAAAPIAYPPLDADALRVRGELEELSGEAQAAEATLGAAFAAAVRGRDDRLAARIGIDLVWVIGYRELRFAEARRWGDIASASISRLGGAPDLQADLDSNLSGIEDLAGDQPRALTLVRQALEYYRGTFGPDHPTIGRTLNRVGAVLFNMQRYDEALAVFQEAYDHTRRTLGESHPTLAVRLANLALAYEALGSRDRAIASQREAMAIEERALGPDHPQFALSLGNLGEMLGAQGNWQEDAELQRRALDIQSRASGEDSAEAAVTRCSLAEALGHLGRTAEALAEGERAVRVLVAQLGEDHAWSGTALGTWGWLLLEAGRPAEASRALARALTGVRRREGPELQLPDVEFHLARALAASGGDVSRARALAEEARAAYQGLRGREQVDGALRDVEAFLAGLGRRLRG